MPHILIVGAVQEEVDKIQAWLKGEHHQIKLSIPLSYWIRKKGKHTLYLVQSGIGKVAGAVSVTALLGIFPIDYILNTGSAGGLLEEQTFGDLILASEVAYYDVDVTGFHYKWGQIPQMPPTFPASSFLFQKAKQCAYSLGLVFHKGLIVSGDSFIHTKEQVSSIKNHFPQAIAVEMEAGAISQVAYLYRIPCLIIRALSDKADKQATSNFQSFLEKASHSSSLLIQKIVNSL